MNLSLILLYLTPILGLATGRCVFNGIAYQEGETILDACVQLICRQTSKRVYTWQLLSNAINKECDECCVENDPHIYPFDHPGYYDWHGTCRYSLAQHIDSWINPSSPPQFAVYGDFKDCGYGSSVSCVHITSYQLSALLKNVIHVKHDDVFKIYDFNFGFSTTIISGNPTPVVINSVNYDALAWQIGECLRILGPDLLVHICPDYVCIYTSTKYLNHLGGLCGKYNNDADDDHTGKNNVDYLWYTNVPAFAQTWQVDPLPPPYEGDDCDTGLGQSDGCSEEELDRYREICFNYLRKCNADEQTLINTINSCAEDLCAFPDDQEHWLEVALKFCLYQASKFDGGEIKG